MTPTHMNTETRALTVRQPFAACIAHGGKTVENRDWATGWRGPLLIHAARTADHGAFDHPPVVAALETADAWPAAGILGAVVAVAVLADCHPGHDCTRPACRPWGLRHPGAWHWVLTHIRALPEPVPARGALGLWRPGPGLVRQVIGGRLAETAPGGGA